MQINFQNEYRKLIKSKELSISKIERFKEEIDKEKKNLAEVEKILKPYEDILTMLSKENEANDQTNWLI